MLLTVLIYLLLGVLAGILSGLFGIGGGLVIVPVLLTVLPWMGVAPEVLIHLAIGTSLATIVVTSSSGIRAHNKRGNVDWETVKRFVPWVVLGSFTGGSVAALLPGALLERLFGIFLLLVATQMWFSLKPNPDRSLPKTPGLALAGGIIGTISSMFGIGGATISVPFLRWCSLPITKAVGVSATLAFPIALSGVISYLINGWGHPQLPEWSLGYVYLPAFFGIVVASTQFVRVGATLAVKLPGHVLQRAFAAFMAILGVRLLML
ncbi:sulfite exporter TauE/SafE family protein [Ferrimonas balearica]|uniref:sulfite exporter TauE/SafE family protein n=1 Tax=Ferrimonas balearica TaxID=44012 RepID=UPI001C579E1F|nr:sulfite exporter TauE/SafE family protein [Ferrimonas balearica]MBW3141111.1 sulfite exporter TauE/SafE family protein [Ferrimonas balearica]MBW3165687.1 sulfite exporter TauE/SafE family protein [Ferrimonas balearica]MBY6107865.1 sulfite exporter TauE/SafE family protein [Ferrimonas balearica]MBY6225206.1 sulfite exporter TauE/SafE family protein [Ferrimonas balearica]